LSQAELFLRLESTDEFVNYRPDLSRGEPVDHRSGQFFVIVLFGARGPGQIGFDTAEHATTASTKESSATDSGSELGATLGTPHSNVSAKVPGSDRREMTTEKQEAYQRSKTDFLLRHILDYQRLFREMSVLSSGDSFLFLDDLYHIRRADQPQVIDYFHRIAKGSSLWLKIGTIRHRTQWYVHGDPPVGVKLGDDADEIDLDLTLEKYSFAKDFLTKVLTSFVADCGNLSIPQILNEGAIDRLVLAAAGSFGISWRSSAGQSMWLGSGAKITEVRR
jgi:hypothetical protein